MGEAGGIIKAEGIVKCKLPVFKARTEEPCLRPQVDTCAKGNLFKYIVFQSCFQGGRKSKLLFDLCGDPQTVRRPHGDGGIQSCGNALLGVPVDDGLIDVVDMCAEKEYGRKLCNAAKAEGQRGSVFQSRNAVLDVVGLEAQGGESKPVGEACGDDVFVVKVIAKAKHTDADSSLGHRRSNDRGHSVERLERRDSMVRKGSGGLLKRSEARNVVVKRPDVGKACRRVGHAKRPAAHLQGSTLSHAVANDKAQDQVSPECFDTRGIF